jgi:hypothetical protein
MSELDGKIVVDQSTFTLRDFATIDELSGGAMSNAQQPGAAPKLMAAFACVVVRRTDPDFTYEQALDLKTSDVEFVGGAPEVAGGDGMTPPSSPAFGVSTRST